MSVRLAPQLEACTAPNDEVAVTGALALAIADGAEQCLGEEYEKLIVQTGFRSVAALRAIKERHLLEMGLDIGTAALLFEVIKPPAAVEVIAIGAAPNGVNVTRMAPRLEPMRPFPAVDSGGLPDLNGMRVYGASLQAHVWPVISEQTRAAFRAIDADARADISARVAGGPDDEAIYSSMVNGS